MAHTKIQVYRRGHRPGISAHYFVNGLNEKLSAICGVQGWIANNNEYKEIKRIKIKKISKFYVPVQISSLDRLTRQQYNVLLLI